MNPDTVIPDSPETDATLAAWRQVCGLRPRLQVDCSVYRHRYRGRNSYVLRDELNSSHYRLTAPAWALVSHLDGRISVEDALARVPEPERAELDTATIILLLSGLQKAGLLQVADASLAPVAASETEVTGSAGWLQKLRRPFMLRLPLWNPDPLLERLQQRLRPLFHPLALWLGVGLLFWALLTGLQHWSELRQHFASRFVDPLNLLSLWLLYPLVKLVHELAHGLVVKVRGAAVHEMGVMLLLLMPVPYVDASESTAFPQRRQRMGVAAAGILAELTLAALALVVWLTAETQWLRDLAFNVMFIGAASTLLFNGNPLLRFDGYYVLCDALDMPNLAPRAQQWLGYASKRWLFGLRQAPAPIVQAGEKPWLVCYGLASGAYRLFIGVAIALWLASQFFILGLMLALWFLVLQILQPARRNLASLWTAAAREGRTTAVLWRGGGLLAGLILCVAVLPVTQSTSALGIIRLPEQAEIRSTSEGFVELVRVASGERVVVGQVLLQLRNPELQRDLAVASARTDELRARYRQASEDNRVEAAILLGQLQQQQRELQDLEQRLARLTLRSQVTGRVQLPAAVDLPGRFVKQGQVLGQVHGDRPLRARVVVDQRDVARIQGQTETLDLRLFAAPGRAVEAQLVGATPQALEQLPSPLLGSREGGMIAVDAADPEGVQPLRRVFEFELELAGQADNNLLGTRVAVRFIHARAPLLQLAWMRLQQWWLDSPIGHTGLH